MARDLGRELMAVTTMLEITRYETRRRMLRTGAITAGLAGITLLFLSVAPEIIRQIDSAVLVSMYPQSVRNAFGIETLGTLEWFLASELYRFGWVLFLGLYVSYSAGSMIASEVEHDRMDVLLSAPVSRSSVVREKFFSLFVSILVINVVVGSVVYLGTRMIGKPLSIVDIVTIHALSIPYLLVCAAIGLLLSVSLSTSSTARRASLVVVFCLFLIESLVRNTYYEWIAMLSPTYYYNPTEILIHNTYDLTSTVILLVTTAVLFGVSLLRFQRMDIR
jgi:ABC-2 type transport system permease protein